jgi:hypothetical protein
MAPAQRCKGKGCEGEEIKFGREIGIIALPVVVGGRERESVCKSGRVRGDGQLDAVCLWMFAFRCTLLHKVWFAVAV